jgi:hypothetical protein
MSQLAELEEILRSTEGCKFDRSALKVTKEEEYVILMVLKQFREDYPEISDAWKKRLDGLITRIENLQESHQSVE